MSSLSNLITVLCVLLTICGAIQNSSPIAKSLKLLKKTIFLTRATVHKVDGDGATKHVEFGVEDVKTWVLSMANSSWAAEYHLW